MVSVSVRPWVSGIALATAGAIAAGPVVAAPSTAPAALSAVHIDDIRLAGIGQDIYNAITPGVQYVVSGGSYLVNFVPLIGGPIAAQININYFQGIQPAVQATVNYLAGVVADPLNIIGTTQAYAVALYDIGYNYVSAQLTFLGLPPLAPLPPIAASTPARATLPSTAALSPSAEPGAATPAVKVGALRAARGVRPAAAAPVSAARASEPTAAVANTSRPETSQKASRGTRASARAAAAN